MDPFNMVKSISTILLLAAPFLTQASDIFVADLTPKGQLYQLENSRNITARSGYDNQPMFNKDGSGLYYTAMFTQGDQQQTDSLFYNFADKSRTNITNTPKFSEYSPTPINDETALSMIFVDETGSQKLWQTDIKTGEQTPINLSIEPVGYHAWGKNKDLLLFVLGDEMMLQYATDAKQQQAEVITKNIGRSLRYNQTKDFFTFSKGKEEQTLYRFDAATKAITPLLALPKGSQYYTWLDQDTVISASGSNIYYWHYEPQLKTAKWQLLADVTKDCPTSVSRLAVAPNQSKLAFVCEEK